MPWVKDSLEGGLLEGIEGAKGVVAATVCGSSHSAKVGRRRTVESNGYLCDERVEI